MILHVPVQLRCSAAQRKSFRQLPTRPLSLLGERGKRHLAHSVAVPWQWGRGVSHGQIWLHLDAQGSWAEGGSASASPFLLGDELEAGPGQFLAEHYDLRRSVDPQADAAVVAACTTVTRMDSLMRMLSPTFRERTSMIDPSMMSLAATGPSMTLVGYNCPLPVASRPLC